MRGKKVGGGWWWRMKIGSMRNGDGFNGGIVGGFRCRLDPVSLMGQKAERRETVTLFEIAFEK
jgi:hypothetical protein